MELFLTILNHGVAAFLLLAIFGVSMASFALKHERREQLGPELDEDFAERTALPPDPYELKWWCEVGSHHELHFANGETWRGFGDLNWARVSDGVSVGKVDSELGEEFGRMVRLVKFDDAEMLRKHAWYLQSWEPDPHGYRLTLLNGEEWVWSTKHAAWGDNPSEFHVRWQPPRQPSDILRSVLDRRLQQVLKEESQQQERALDAARAPAGEGGSGAVVVTDRDTGIRATTNLHGTCGHCDQVRPLDQDGLCKRCR